MSGRCRACDAKLTDIEMCAKKRDRQHHQVLYTDLCYRCQSQGVEEQFTLRPLIFEDFDDE